MEQGKKAIVKVKKMVTSYAIMRLIGASSVFAVDHKTMIVKGRMIDY